MRFHITFAIEARQHLRALSAGERRKVLDRIEGALESEPTWGSKHRKQLRPNPLARWELRVGELRVFYDVPEGTQEVVVLGVGRKVGNRLWLGGKEYLI
jgi:mRNA-degrading endonuclease RelE of RelBE toxin-antitoxin system